MWTPPSTRAEYGRERDVHGATDHGEVGEHEGGGEEAKRTCRARARQYFHSPSCFMVIIYLNFRTSVIVPKAFLLISISHAANLRFVCDTGDCGSEANGFGVECRGVGGQPPATLAELTLRPAGNTADDGNTDFYDISNVDGHSVEVSV